MIKHTLKTEREKIMFPMTSETLPYPCLLRYASNGYDYIVLAIEPVGGGFKGMIVKVSKEVENDEIYEGAIDRSFSVASFGTPEGFNFYNEEITIKNSVSYQ